MIRRIFRFIFVTVFTTTLLGAIAASLVGLYFYFRLTRDMPRIEKLEDYRPKAVSSIYAADGTLMAEVYEERRYPVRFNEVPMLVKNAFLAAEDANFYSHPGIDIISIFRAIYVNLVRHRTKQGASTITQQVVKSLLLSKEKTYERKAKEAILSYKLEKALTKDEIFSIYLNDIFLGNHAYGIRAASRVHFHKELDQLSIAEAAFLAGLPQKPSELMNPKNHDDAIHRQGYVLGQMLSNKMITQAEYDTAKKFPIKIYPPNNNTLYHAPYYVSHVIQVAEESLRTVDKKYSLRNPGGFSIHTAADIHANEIAERAVQRGLREIDKRRGWRGPIVDKKPKGKEQSREADPLDTGYALTAEGVKPGKVYRAKVISVNRATGVVEVRIGEFEGSVKLAGVNWAKRLLEPSGDAIGTDPVKVIQPGNFIEVSLIAGQLGDPPLTDVSKKLDLQLDQTPEVEGAFVVNNVWTGEVVAIVGGYDYEKSVFNRATQGHLQPGSSFKPFIYVAAIDSLHYSPSTLVPDSPISLVAGNGKIWSPSNFDHKYLGPIPLRRALERSRNVVSVYLLNKMGVERGIQSARNLGITTPIAKNLSIALGTPEVIPLEMVRAYGAFASGGRLADSLVVSSIKDLDGKTIFEKRPAHKQVLSEESAFLMANMMKGVVERGTAMSVKPLAKPVAGKTGTTNNHMDAWFIGYTPDWAAGAWTGFDVKRTLGKQETGGKAAAPIFLYFMQEFLADTPGIDFNIPDGVTPVAVDLSSGRPTDPENPGAFIEYFKNGEEPSDADTTLLNEYGESGSTSQGKDYLESDEF